MRFEIRGSLAALAAVVAAASSCVGDDPLPKDDVLRVEGTLPGPGGAQDIAFADSRSRGEWWPCDARFTAQACVDDGDRSYHVNVFIGRPERAAIDELGNSDCVVDGAPQGAFELLRDAYNSGTGTAVIGEDVTAFVVVAADADADGSADVDAADETLAIGAVDEGSIGIFSLNDFTDPLGFRLRGSVAGADVAVDFLGAMSNPAQVPALEPPTTCVAE